MAADIRRDVPPAVASLSSPWAVLAVAAAVVASAALAVAAARSGDLAVVHSVAAVPVVAGKTNSIFFFFIQPTGWRCTLHFLEREEKGRPGMKTAFPVDTVYRVIVRLQ